MWAKWGRIIRRWFDDPRFLNSRRVRLGMYMGLAAGIYLILLGSVLPPHYGFKVGQTSPVTIRAPITAVDTQKTQASRQAAMDKVPKQYVESPDVEKQALSQADRLFTTATQVVSDSSLSAADKMSLLQAAAPKKVSSSTLQALLSLSVQQISTLQGVSGRIVQDLLSVPFYQDSTNQAVLLVDREMLNFDLNHVSRLIVQDVCVGVLQPNMIYKQQETQAAVQAAARAVPESYIHQGDVIVSKNGVVTPSVISELRDVGLYGNPSHVGMMFGFALVIVIAIALLAGYIENRSPRRRIDNLMLLVFALILVLVIFFIAITKGIIVSGGPSSLAYLVPIATGAMLITAVTDSSLASAGAIFISLMYGAALGFDFWMIFMGLVSSLVGAYSVSKVTHRATFMRAGFLVSLSNITIVLAMHLLQADVRNGYDWGFHMGLGLLNGVISAILAMGILPFFENAFSLLTAIRLLELSNPNNPLLKKLLMQAPGSYHHSLIVGNLAEAAAELVGADPLICRVGAYYHDVGKMRRPAFFVENQMTKENPHDKIAPSLSHLIITSHVSDGLEMLEEAGLPKPIRDICGTHHGTTILWYFYNKAREMDKTGSVRVDDYRYRGPRPKSREQAIVMICDAVEAAVRSMSRPSPGRIEGVIRKIIRDRLQDGQLDQCDLTLQDLDMMVGSFMKTLQGIYHTRIEYPDPEKIRKEGVK